MIPVIGFAYNRPDKIIRCLSSLSECAGADETEVFIFSDGPKSQKDEARVNEVRTALNDFAKDSCFKKLNIICAEKNKGLAKSIIEGITELFKDFEMVIVIEDDLVFSKNFLKYMNGALCHFKDDMSVGAVSGYRYPVNINNGSCPDAFLGKKGECWGWGTWKNRWQNVDWDVQDYAKYKVSPKMRRNFDNLELGWDSLFVMQQNGLINSWAIRWCYYLYQNELYTVYPGNNKVSNLGFDSSGTHCKESDAFVCEFANEEQELFDFKNVRYDKKAAKKMSSYPKHYLELRGGMMKHYILREITFLKDFLRR